MAQNEIDNAIPASFADAFAGDYLGNPEVATRLIAEFCTSFESLLTQRGADDLSAAEFIRSTRDLIMRFADICSGREPAYTVVMGYHDATLAAKLIADLGDFWGMHRENWNDDPVAVLFLWLGLILADKLKLAKGDEMLLDIMLKPSIEYTVSIILGTEKRQKPDI
jgi:hypothetical protein